MKKDLIDYIEKFNISQHKDLDSIEKFPLEIFFPITDLTLPNIKNGYYISNYSRVYSTITKKFLKITVNSVGYYSFSCQTNDGRSNKVMLHRILMMVFNPLDDYTDMVVNHKDGNKLNSFLYNLEWCTVRENSIHARDTGLLNPVHGETHCCATITVNQAKLICQYLESRRYRLKDIATKVGVNVGIVQSIKSGKAWREISEKYDLKFKTERLSGIFSFEDIHGICKFFQDNPKDNEDSLRQHCIRCLNSLNLEVTPSNINSLRKLYKKERWKFICNNYNY